MTTAVVIREYARLTTEAVPVSLDEAQVSTSAFDWLCDLSGSFSRSGATLLQVEGRRSLRWDSYVGVLETPCGTRIEILPKHFEQGDCIQRSRALLRTMIQGALDLKARQASIAGLDLFDAPLTEWVMGQFLSELDQLTKRGIRFDYKRVEEEQRFLRGQLNVVAQMRQPPGRQHHFQIRHDVFVPDRAENRLLALALEHVAKTTQDADNWRLANELRSLLAQVPTSRDVSADLKAWSRDRLMAHYQPIKPWCELILNQQMPVALARQWQGMSLLFPMERLFERYVQASLSEQLQPGARLKPQSASEYLCLHDQGAMFRLKPDLLIDTPQQRWILDTKWKRVSAGSRDKNYGLSQSDFYQLFAYGHKYGLEKSPPTLVLIYPYWSGFLEPLPVFEYGKDMGLWVLPFDLENKRLMGVELADLPLRSQLFSASSVEMRA